MRNARNRNYENVNKRRFPGSGIYEIPMIEPEEWDGCEFIGFNYAASCQRRENTGIHFFLDDYQFLRLWNMIDYYLPLLRQFRYVMSPDFSIYADFPLAMQIYNHYRKHWVGAYLQENGIRVIPTISWGDSKSYDWCFDGEPIQGTVSVSAVGTRMNPLSREMFFCGYREMLRRLQPAQIIFYGTIPEECQGENVFMIPAFQEKFRNTKERS